MEEPIFSFEALVTNIRQADEELASQASRAVNIRLTLRNWLMGFYIEEYERKGVDRQRYGDKLLTRLSQSLKEVGVSRCDGRELYRYRQFYLTYPQIVETLSPQLASLTDRAIPSPQTDKLEGIAGIQQGANKLSGHDIITKLSFSHIAELLRCEDDSKRTFYETESIRGNWAVRELRRQIDSLYYERSALSRNKTDLSKLTQKDAEQAGTRLEIRDPYVFEFLGLKPVEVMGESHLEEQLLDKIQGFLLELGHGFCFEGRQRRILIGDTHNFVDIVFYHRILKCHVLVEDSASYVL